MLPTTWLLLNISMKLKFVAFFIHEQTIEAIEMVKMCGENFFFFNELK